MTIEKLKIDDRADSNSYNVIVAKKINEIIDYVNSKDQFSDNSGKVEQDWVEEAFNRFCDTTHYEGDANDMAMFRDAIETFMSKPVEQEPNKVELVPLDERAIGKIYGDFTGQHRGDTVSLSGERWDKFKSVMSKYGVPKQKKFTGKELRDYCEQEHLGDSIASYTYITSFLRHKNMIEE